MPSPTKDSGPQPLDFPDALRIIIGGGKITKLEWGDPRIYVCLNDSYLSIHKTDGKFYRLTVSDGDLFGEDWVPIFDQPLH